MNMERHISLGLFLGWGASMRGSERTIDSHVTKLRKKLSELGDADAEGKEWIVSTYGVGYKIEL